MAVRPAPANPSPSIFISLSNQCPLSLSLIVDTYTYVESSTLLLSFFNPFRQYPPIPISRIRATELRIPRRHAEHHLPISIHHQPGVIFYPTTKPSTIYYPIYYQLALPPPPALELTLSSPPNS